MLSCGTSDLALRTAAILITFMVAGSFEARADDACRCDTINAQSKARGLCTRTQMTGSCLMVWNTADGRLADATNRAPAAIAESMPTGSSFTVTDLKGANPSGPPSQVATNNLNAISPEEYSINILPSYLTIAGGALLDADEGGFLKEATPRALGLGDQILSALKGGAPFQWKFGKYSLLISLGCFKVNTEGSRNVEVLVKTRFANVDICH